jgi:hypothetical protein
MVVLFCLSRSGCPILAVLFWLSYVFLLSCSACPVRLSCSACPVLQVLSACPVSPVLFRLPGLSVLF